MKDSGHTVALGLENTVVLGGKSHTVCHMYFFFFNFYSFIPNLLLRFLKPLLPDVYKYHLC